MLVAFQYALIGLILLGGGFIAARFVHSVWAQNRIQSLRRRGQLHRAIRVARGRARLARFDLRLTLPFRAFLPQKDAGGAFDGYAGWVGTLASLYMEAGEVGEAESVLDRALAV